MAAMWLLVLAFMAIETQTAAQSGITATIFSATSKSVIVRWTHYSGASSYKVTLTPKNSPSSPATFSQFGPNTVMGSVAPLAPNTIYTVLVEALDSSQILLSRTIIESPTAPEIPSILSVTSEHSDKLNVEFTEMPGATSYKVRIEIADGSFFREESFSSSPAVVSSLQPYTEYSLSVMAVNSGSHSQPSNHATGKTVLPRPELSSSSPTNASMVLSWDPVEYAVLYTVMVSEVTPSAGGDVVLNTTDSNVTLSDLAAGWYYNIIVHAWDSEGRPGERASGAQFTRPPTPVSVNVSVEMSADVAGLLVSWALGQEVMGTLHYSAQSDAGLSCNSTSTSCLLSPVGCGEIHTIQVTTINQAGPSLSSDPVVFITFPCPPDALAVTEVEAGNCTLTWSTVPHADSYKAFIKRNDGGEEICNTTGSSCDYHCQCGYTYFMSVYAFNQAGSSPQGQVLNYTTLPCCPDDVSISLVTTETLEMTWTPVRGAELYETKAVEGLEVILCNDTAPVCALSNLMCDTAYSVVVMPCNDIRGCNHNCRPHTKDTAPCMPTQLTAFMEDASTFNVSWSGENRAAVYEVSALGEDDVYTCNSTGPAHHCRLTNLPCGSIFDVSVIATTAAGQSLPSFSIAMETQPCCPATLNVEQVTMAMTNVSWSHARGARSFITSLTSPRGEAACHTQDLHCLMGCITCGTNYTVEMEAFSRSGHSAHCSYQGFSSSPCCPSGVKLYRMATNTLRVYWRSPGNQYNHTVDIMGSTFNYTCSPLPGANSCDVNNMLCGDVYHVVVAPITTQGHKVPFCLKRTYSVTCSGVNVGSVIYRGKRSVD